MNEAEEVINRIKGYKPPPNLPPLDGAPGSGDDDRMEERLRTLEHTVAVIEAKLPDLATNDGVDARLSKTEAKIIIWVVSAVIATGLAGKFLFPPAAPAASSAPIVIQMPAPPPPSAPK